MFAGSRADFDVLFWVLAQGGRADHGAVKDLIRTVHPTGDIPLLSLERLKLRGKRVSQAEAFQDERVSDNAGHSLPTLTDTLVSQSRTDAGFCRA